MLNLFSIYCLKALSLRFYLSVLLLLTVFSSFAIWPYWLLRFCTCMMLCKLCIHTHRYLHRFRYLLFNFLIQNLRFQIWIILFSFLHKRNQISYFEFYSLISPLMYLFFVSFVVFEFILNFWHNFNLILYLILKISTKIMKLWYVQVAIKFMRFYWRRCYDSHKH